MSMAPQFWRFTPALALASGLLFVLIGHVFADARNALTAFDWNTFRFVGLLSLLAAAFAFYQSPRIDRLTAWTVIAAAFAADWCAFVVTGQYGSGAAFVEVLIASFYALSALAIVGSAYARYHWLRWLALPLLMIGAALCLIWFGHDLIYIYGPQIIRALTPTPA